MSGSHCMKRLPVITLAQNFQATSCPCPGDLERRFYKQSDSRLHVAAVLTGQIKHVFCQLRCLPSDLLLHTCIIDCFYNVIFADVSLIAQHNRHNGLRMFRYFTVRYLYVFATYTSSLPTFSPPTPFRYPAFSLPSTIIVTQFWQDT